MLLLFAVYHSRSPDFHRILAGVESLIENAEDIIADLKQSLDRV